ncbi:RES family NAD+ phosphorylase [Salinisphaera sp.]|uniref:RES family NAD+ phosphorylase n=1 Tax=Salinisphaera sp. TaxID=1914330 RepID=UPI000C5AAB8B|nr:RES family NAD+ phosphorylase [Salinisphaera sp.]MBS64386.1 hypothetical protein [Salinisphaera sp.]
MAYNARDLREIVCDYLFDGRFVRISPAKYSQSPLTYGRTPSRFSGPPTPTDPTLATFGALYLAATVKTATCETLIHTKSRQRVAQISTALLTSRVLFVYKRTTQSLKLLDLRQDYPVIAGVTPDVIHQKEHDLAQALSAFVRNHLPELDGIIYPSWYTGEDCLALYESGVDKIDHDYTIALTQHEGLYQALDRYRVRLIEPAG